MASGNKQVQQLARQLFRMSVINGELSTDRVMGVLQYVEKHRPAHSLALLKSYQRLVTAEISRGEAVVEHAGAISNSVLTEIAVAMTTKYRRRVTSVSRRNDSLLAGLRIRVGDDVFESSVASQLAQLSGAV